MGQFAGFNSNSFVKSRLQAALYWARKRRLQRLKEQQEDETPPPDPDPEPQEGE